MKTIKTLLTTIAVLLCSITANAVTYSDWTSTNQGQSSSTSSNTYTITASVGDVLSFDWLVSSESNYDKLIITIGGTEILNKSGELSGTYQHTFASSGNHTMVVKYTKDGSLDKNGDYAKVCNIVLSGTNSGNGETNNVIASGTCGTNLTWELTNKGELIIEGTGDITDSPWFTYWKDIKSVSIPSGVTSIGNTAFRNCSSLTAITIPEGVTSIGAGAFLFCSNLTDINIPENSQLTNIESNAFSQCSSLTAITIPESVTSIGSYAFEDCSSLTAINIPESVTNIGSGAFDGTAWYKNQPDGVIYINKVLYEYKGTMPANTSIEVKEGTVCFSSYAFYNCSSLTAINIPESMTSIGDYVFEGCRSLTTVNIPENSQLTSIGDNAFYYCNSLTSINIPESVTNIGDNAFGFCNNMVSITIPNSVASIGDAAFNQCVSLTTIVLPERLGTITVQMLGFCSSLSDVYIPSSVTAIQIAAFSACRNIGVITCEAVIPPTVENPSDKGLPATANAFYGVPTEECVLYVPQESVDAYKESYGWSSFTNILPIKKDLKLNDGESFLQTEIEECASITYTRTFNNINWQALYVPFEIPVTEEFLADFEVADLNDVRQYDRDDDGVKDETVIEAFKVTSGVLEANYPYLIRAKEAGEKTITVTDATLFAAEENSIDCSSVREKFTFTGTYSQLSSEELPQSEGYYALSGGIWRPVAEGTSLGAFRFYLKVDSRSALNAGQGNAIRMRIIGEDGEEDGATGIDNPGFENQNSESIFDLQGRRVENPTKGVYIVNGVKRVF